MDQNMLNEIDRNDVVKALAAQFYDKAVINLDALGVEELAGFYRQADYHMERLNFYVSGSFDQGVAMGLISVITQDQSKIENPYKK